ncbi:MAG: 2-methylcitrate synthase [Gammaproteobacteria bacterium]|nr:2-methylcitrate synthase [Gammaproteobacteria bacterium]MYF27365.1 2-methylcitrate synthase [Gammaproteobacteria bacterium]MYK46091.1 2-methylcitrate synthase [Gammaproteobacteria bacterium]
MPDRELGGAGLRGQSAGETALCTVGRTGTGLTYRGYDIADLAAEATFEEVAHLIVHGELPNARELDVYRDKLKRLRGLPDALKEVLERIPAHAHPMDVMRTGCSVLGNLEPEGEFGRARDVANRLLGVMPSIVNYWYRYSHDGVRIDLDTDEDSIAGHFLATLKGEAPSALFQRVLDVSLILYAEHEFNASTFTARVCASTLSDMHSCVTGAIGSLRGPLHGGANEAAMDLIEGFETPEAAVAEVREMLARKEVVMGFGHAIYRRSDPRNAIIKRWAEELAPEVGDERVYPISCAIEKLMWDEKALFPNADFFHAAAYRFLGIPTKLFTPIFVCSRVSGWTAHVMEQRHNNRIIRPSADYVGPDPRPFPGLGTR